MILTFLMLALAGGEPPFITVVGPHGETKVPYTFAYEVGRA